MDGVARAKFLEYAQYCNELLQLEKDVLQCAENNWSRENYCAINSWYGTFKPRMIELVGYSAKDEHLKSVKAYDTVYQYLYWLLPDCNHKSSCWIEQKSELH